MFPSFRLSSDLLETCSILFLLSLSLSIPGPSNRSPPDALKSTQATISETCWFSPVLSTVINQSRFPKSTLSAPPSTPPAAPPPLSASPGATTSRWLGGESKRCWRARRRCRRRSWRRRQARRRRGEREELDKINQVVPDRIHKWIHCHPLNRCLDPKRKPSYIKESPSNLSEGMWISLGYEKKSV